MIMGCNYNLVLITTDTLRFRKVDEKFLINKKDFRKLYFEISSQYFLIKVYAEEIPNSPALLNLLHATFL